MLCLISWFGWPFVTMTSMECVVRFSVTVAHVSSPLSHENVEEWMSILAYDVSDLVRHRWYVVRRFVVCRLLYVVCCMS